MSYLYSNPVMATVHAFFSSFFVMSFAVKSKISYNFSLLFPSLLLSFDRLFALILFIPPSLTITISFAVCFSNQTVAVFSCDRARSLRVQRLMTAFLWPLDISLPSFFHISFFTRCFIFGKGRSCSLCLLLMMDGAITTLDRDSHP